ncbi:glycosyltransferase family 2 protein [Chryseobacterium taklimakanense]|uniref:glycosyltransferase family 2 protein n=1 Tax=Chryseobacterium taklimakanense TaxID=536441 RepID=UPI000F5FED7E|nr:glycosyltransferase family A protein [Chryseobacterium taklimakanense]AZI23392.1 glycosyltransferase family 2 protein [Chryseobacterium taklimakanense]
MISVVIPMYNSAGSIVRALDSIKNQDYRGEVEIIVVNDGSKDNSREIVEDYQLKNPSQKISLINQVNGGVSKARNAGMKNAKGKYIAFLDSDDAWFRNKLSTQEEIFIKNPEVDLLAAAFDGLFFSKRNEGDLIKVNVKDLVYKNYFQPSTVVMKRDVIETVGYFDENQKYAEEGNYFIRVANQFKCYFLNSKLINYGDGKSGFGHSGLSANVVEMQKGFMKNLKYAHENKFIDYPTYLSAVIFSRLKYLRRLLIIKFLR